VDETYQAYLNRVTKLTLPNAYRNQIQNIQESPKFHGGMAVPFPGYTINTPGEADGRNQNFYARLVSTQALMMAAVEEMEPGLILPVPSESFHLTVADLIWDSNYYEALAHTSDYEGQLCDRLAQSFTKYQASIPERGPIKLQIVGLLVRPRAVAIVLVPIDELSYHKMLQLRRAVYQNSGLIALGIEQQYPFTAHIPLGYFAHTLNPDHHDRFLEIIMNLNDRWLGAEPEILRSHRAELHKFDDMNHFYHQPQFPTVDF